MASTPAVALAAAGLSVLASARSIAERPYLFAVFSPRTGLPFGVQSQFQERMSLGGAPAELKGVRALIGAGQGTGVRRLRMEFHIARSARERYQFNDTLFSSTGNVVFASFAACRAFAHRMNQVREAAQHPERTVHPGQLYAMGLIDEASHALMARYREQVDPAVITAALDWYGQKVGVEKLNALLLAFVEEFPGQSVLRGLETPRQWLAGQTGNMPHRAAAFEELLLLWMANRNAAFQPFAELFEDKRLVERTVYRVVTAQLPDYFATRPRIAIPGAKPVTLLELLEAPSQPVGNKPHRVVSLADQLVRLRTLWRPLLGSALDELLDLAASILHEEEVAIWLQFHPPGSGNPAHGPRKHGGGLTATAEVPDFATEAHEYEKFSPDQAWMPTAVLIAKSTYVWLAQLSRQFGRAINHLDEIPDEALATLAERGLDTLWLIGIWERSRASRTIKQICGNKDAVASAYSLFDYRIADDLGGEPAYVSLRDRAFRYGIRLASDMVPNHMGIDSPWVVEHPEWFLSRYDCPYPTYSFNGPDLSADARVEIKIEDHYFDQTDAAVVFRRIDRATGDTRYVYHGNDGTSFPWNDTAQLDYLNPAVREQIIQTILHVARLFPVIRFDAAMTLAKRHVHRLWFPGPGAEGAIPSRAEYGMSQAAFDRAMPEEFWREVVDRVAQEVPGTLLLAEAFWFMEGYFVRTLGMHRVYNSAFMVMLRDEDNANYRTVIKKTLEFDPEIMKRYVNFMSNPDERTTIDQFGSGDKCFGVAVMMSTVPGLPMFGHGQIEGFTEKYGMEYRWPRMQEDADPALVDRHMRQIAPLLERRALFAESANFLLYDLYTGSGAVDENVFAYSNRLGDERALVVYHNRFAETRGTLDHSAAYADKANGGLRQRRLAEGLGLSGDRAAILSYRDALTGLEYLLRASDFYDHGFTVALHAYQCYVFLDWCELYPTEAEPWDKLCDELAGKGVAHRHDALATLELAPVHDALRGLLDPSLLARCAAAARDQEKNAFSVRAFCDEAWPRCLRLLKLVQPLYARRTGRAADADPNHLLLAPLFRQRLHAALRLPLLEAQFPASWSPAARSVLPGAGSVHERLWAPILALCVFEELAESIDAQHPELVACDLFDAFRFREPLARAFAALGCDDDAAWRAVARIKLLLLIDSTAPGSAALIPPALWDDPDLRWLAGVHEAEGHTYLVRESYESLLWALALPALLRLAASAVLTPAEPAQLARRIAEALQRAEAAGYRLDLLLAPPAAPSSAAKSRKKSATARKKSAIAQKTKAAPAPAAKPSKQRGKAKPAASKAKNKKKNGRRKP
jgi:glycosidase